MPSLVLVLLILLQPLLMQASVGQTGPEQTGPEQISPGITVEPTGTQSWRFTISATDETDPQRLVARLSDKVAALCADRGYHFGRYTFRMNQTLDQAGRPMPVPQTLTVVQDAACGPEPETKPAPDQEEGNQPGVTADPASRSPVRLGEITPADTLVLNQELQAASEAYFQALEDGRHDEAFAVVDPGMTGGQTFIDWKADQLVEQRTRGPRTGLQIGRLTWYANPAGAPPGHYGAADFIARRSSKDECGYLVWFRGEAGAPLRLIRQEMTFLPRSLNPETRAALRQQYCIIL